MTGGLDTSGDFEYTTAMNVRDVNGGLVRSLPRDATDGCRGGVALHMGCPARSPEASWLCTQSPGHDGPHEAGDGAWLLARWSR